MFFSELFNEEVETDAMRGRREVMCEKVGGSCLICGVVLKEVREEYELRKKDDLYTHMLNGVYLEEVLRRQKKFEHDFEKARQERKRKQREKTKADNEALMRPSSRPMPHKRNTTNRTKRLAEIKLAKESDAKKKAKPSV